MTDNMLSDKSFFKLNFPTNKSSQERQFDVLYVFRSFDFNFVKIDYCNVYVCDVNSITKIH